MTTTTATETNYAGLTITHIIERDGFGGEETEADVDAYCQAVANAISLIYPGADVLCGAGLSRRTEIGGDLSDTLDHVEIDGIRTACREAAAAVWEAGDFWTEVEPEITDDQIRALSAEAAAAGDDEQVRLCKLALGGDADARAECERAIGDARAQVDA